MIYLVTGNLQLFESNEYSLISLEESLEKLSTIDLESAYRALPLLAGIIGGLAGLMLASSVMFSPRGINLSLFFYALKGFPLPLKILSPFTKVNKIMENMTLSQKELNLLKMISQYMPVNMWLFLSTISIWK